MDKFTQLNKRYLRIQKTTRDKIRLVDAIVVLQIVLACLMFFPCSSMATTNGYQETVTWWQNVRSQLDEYSLDLQNLYAETEAKTWDKSKVKVAFCNELKQRFPGSSCLSGLPGGTMAINGYTQVRFDWRWDIVGAIQKIGGLTKTYQFGTGYLAPNSFEITDGVNKLGFTLSLETPSQSFFRAGTIPEIAASTQTVYNLRTPHKTKTFNALAEILNDTYSLRIAKGRGMRMDQIAEKMIVDPDFRDWWIAEAEHLYQEKDFRGQGGDISLSQNLVNGLATVPKTLFGGTKPKTSPSSAMNQITTSVQTLLGRLFMFLFILVAGKTFLVFYFKKQKRRLLGTLGKEVFQKISKEPEERHPKEYESQDGLLSPAEQNFFSVLTEVVNQETYHISIKPRLADLVRPSARTRNSQWWRQFGKIKSKHVDFAVMEKAGARIKGVVELDDSSHRRRDRRKRDQFVDRVLTESGIPILHYPCLRKYDRRSLESALQVELSIEPAPFSRDVSPDEDFSFGPLPKPDRG